MHAMFLVTYLRRELQHRFGQALLIATGLAVGVALVISTVTVSAAVGNAQTAVLASLTGIGTDITVSAIPAPNGDDAGTGRGAVPIREAGSPIASSGLIDEVSVNAIAALRHVSDVADSLTLTWITPPHASTDVPTVVRIDGIDTARLAIGPFASAKLRAGRTVETTDASAHVAMLDSRYAASLALVVGSKLTIAGVPLEVVGIVEQAAGSSAADIYLPLSTAQQLGLDNQGHSLAGKVSTIYVSASNSADVDAVEHEIAAVVPSAKLTSSTELADVINGSLSSAMKLSRQLGIWLTLGVLLASGATTILLTHGAVSRRTREFGTLKAMGWPALRIVNQVVAEAMVVGVTGATLGVMLGYLAIAAVNQLAPALTATIGSGDAGNAASPSMSVRLNAHAVISTVEVAVIIAIAASLLAGALAAWRAARLRPAAALVDVD